MSNTTFLYSVTPRKTITGLSNVAAFRSPKSLFLTLEDVKICLDKATVYRRFANEGKLEKVTIGNYERLHNEVFMTEEEYEQFKVNGLSKDASTVKNVAPEVSAPLEEKKEKKAEPEKIEESAPVEEAKSEDAPVEVEAAKEVDDLDAELYESDDEEVVEKVEE